MHGARALLRDRQARLHRDVKLRRRTALAHLVDVDRVLRLRMLVVANLLHTHHRLKDHIGRAKLRHAEGDRAEPADLMLRWHRALVPRARVAVSAVNQREALALRVLELERRTAIKGRDLAMTDRS